MFTYSNLDMQKYCVTPYTETPYFNTAVFQHSPFNRGKCDLPHFLFFLSQPTSSVAFTGVKRKDLDVITSMVRLGEIQEEL